MVAGVLLVDWWTRRSSKRLKRIPKVWPLGPRLVANTEERKVWYWLSEAFPDHHVMLKLPVTRFTLPRSRDQGPHWYQLLSGVYCTLTVCAPNGRVIGCVDVPGNNRISRSNRQLKQTLLSQCGIAYWVIESGNLPTPLEIRNEFLGEADVLATERNQDETMMAATRLKLRASLNCQRKGRRSDWVPLMSTTALPPDGNSESQQDTDSSFGNFNSGLHQDNSFLAPLDSRHVALR